ncbi:hypothetical protein EJ110_NYTH51826 [Nymphaea thermarum]|nr:hypothetical protein EJ110_NYTH51826 [Nymphaea thermarum]
MFPGLTRRVNGVSRRRDLFSPGRCLFSNVDLYKLPSWPLGRGLKERVQPSAPSFLLFFVVVLSIVSFFRVGYLLELTWNLSAEEDSDRNGKRRKKMTGSPTRCGDVAGNGNGTVKFLCSYGGRILPRYPDGRLRYVGGETRVLSLDRSITFAELAVKLGEMSGEPSVIIKCQLPTDDLDALVSVSSDEDVRNLIEEYDQFNQGKAAPLKVRTFLWPRRSKPKAQPSPPPSVKIADAGKAHRPAGKVLLPTCGCCAYPIVFPARACGNQQNWRRHLGPRPVVGFGGSAGYARRTIQAPLRCSAPIPPRNLYAVHNGNYWQ